MREAHGSGPTAGRTARWAGHSAAQRTQVRRTFTTGAACIPLMAAVLRLLRSRPLRLLGAGLSRLHGWCAPVEADPRMKVQARATHGEQQAMRCEKGRQGVQRCAGKVVGIVSAKDHLGEAELRGVGACTPVRWARAHARLRHCAAEPFGPSC